MSAADIAQIWIAIGSIIGMFLMYYGKHTPETARGQSTTAFFIGMAVWVAIWPFAVLAAIWLTWRQRHG